MCCLGNCHRPLTFVIRPKFWKLFFQNSSFGFQNSRFGLPLRSWNSQEIWFRSCVAWVGNFHSEFELNLLVREKKPNKMCLMVYNSRVQNLEENLIADMCCVCLQVCRGLLKFRNRKTEMERQRRTHSKRGRQREVCVCVLSGSGWKKI